MRSLIAQISSILLPPNNLWRASKLGDLSAIRRLAAAGANVNAKRRSLNIEGETPMHFAARYDQPEAVRLLAELDANPNARDDGGTTPLIDACFHEVSSRLVETLIECGAKLDVQDKVGFTALDIAAFKGNERLVKLLLSKGAKPNVEKNGKKSEALSKAIESGRIKVFETLLAAGASLGVSGDPNPALNAAAISGRADFVKLLLKAGADPNTKDRSGIPAIICAVLGKNLEVLELLISAGADLRAKNTEGETALNIAMELKRKEFVSALERAISKQH